MHPPAGKYFVGSAYSHQTHLRSLGALAGWPIQEQEASKQAKAPRRITTEQHMTERCDIDARGIPSMHLRLIPVALHKTGGYMFHRRWIPDRAKLPYASQIGVGAGAGREDLMFCAHDNTRSTTISTSFSGLLRH